MCLADELRFFMMYCLGFVPAFEKIGKTCHIYLTPVHFILLHNVLNSDGVQAIAQFSKVAYRFALGLPNLGGFELQYFHHAWGSLSIYVGLCFTFLSFLVANCFLFSFPSALNRSHIAGNCIRWVSNFKSKWGSHRFHCGPDIVVTSTEEQCKHIWWQAASETCEETSQLVWTADAVSDIWK